MIVLGVREEISQNRLRHSRKCHERMRHSKLHRITSHENVLESHIVTAGCYTRGCSVGNIMLPSQTSNCLQRFLNIFTIRLILCINLNILRRLDALVTPSKEGGMLMKIILCFPHYKGFLRQNVIVESTIAQFV